jgi:hypothetical protein
LSSSNQLSYRGQLSSSNQLSYRGQLSSSNQLSYRGQLSSSNQLSYKNYTWNFHRQNISTISCIECRCPKSSHPPIILRTVTVAGCCASFGVPCTDESRATTVNVRCPSVIWLIFSVVVMRPVSGSIAKAPASFPLWIE